MALVGLAEAFRLGGGSLGLFWPPLALTLDKALGESNGFSRKGL